jgi:hypothetical protein
MSEEAGSESMSFLDLLTSAVGAGAILMILLGITGLNTRGLDSAPLENELRVHVWVENVEQGYRFSETHGGNVRVVASRPVEASDHQGILLRLHGDVGPDAWLHFQVSPTQDVVAAAASIRGPEFKAFYSLSAKDSGSSPELIRFEKALEIYLAGPPAQARDSFETIRNGLETWERSVVAWLQKQRPQGALLECRFRRFDAALRAARAGQPLESGRKLDVQYEVFGRDARRRAVGPFHDSLPIDPSTEFVELRPMVGAAGWSARSISGKTPGALP